MEEERRRESAVGQRFELFLNSVVVSVEEDLSPFIQPATAEVELIDGCAFRNRSNASEIFCVRSLQRIWIRSIADDDQGMVLLLTSEFVVINCKHEALSLLSVVGS